MTVAHDPSETAADAVAGGDASSVPTAKDFLGGVASTLLQGSSVAKAGIGFGAELTRIVLGRSEVEAARNDWRCKDETWTQNPVYKRIAQTYLAACRSVDAVIDDMETNGGSGSAEHARFATGVITSALAPTNFLAGNPAALKRSAAWKTIVGHRTVTTYPA